MEFSLSKTDQKLARGGVEPRSDRNFSVTRQTITRLQSSASLREDYGVGMPAGGGATSAGVPR